jgi:short subunit dehydrogenase-like uncharacterized protein
MSGRIVLFGATGYTGRLVASDLVAIGERPVLAGRHADKLADLSRSLGGLDTAVSDVNRPKSLRDLLDRGDVLVSTVGPFTLYGDVALEAALDAGAHYLDSTGEPAFIRDVFDRAGAIAKRKDATLLTAFGIDWVPGNVAAAAAARKAGADARRLDIGYLVMLVGTRPPGTKRGPGISTGTRASLLAASAAPQHSWRGGRLKLEPTAARLQSFTVDHKTRWGASVGGSEAITLPKLYPHLDEVNVYLEFPGPTQVVRGVVYALATGLGLVSRFKSGKDFVERTVAKAARTTGGGPTEEQRAYSGTQVVAVCRDDSGRRLAAVRIEGPVNGYTITGKTLAWGASALAKGRQLASGATGPVEAFGLDECLSALSGIGLQATDLI